MFLDIYYCIANKHSERIAFLCLICWRIKNIGHLNLVYYFVNYSWKPFDNFMTILWKNGVPLKIIGSAFLCTLLAKNVEARRISTVLYQQSTQNNATCLLTASENELQSITWPVQSLILSPVKVKPF